MKTFLLIISVMFLMFSINCGSGKNVKIESVSAPSSIKAITQNTIYTHEPNQKEAIYTFLDGKETIRISSYQSGIITDKSDSKSPIAESDYGIAVSFNIKVVNKSSKYTFSSFNIGNWFLYDNNQRPWHLLKFYDADKPSGKPKDCPPGSEAAYTLIFGSKDYASVSDLPDKIILKLVGGFEPEIFTATFKEEYEFKKMSD